jgi:vacuolar-type H+-ATPase subunit F/Vma7
MNKRLAVMAEPELVNALRLAGVGRTRSLRAEAGAAETVDETLREWLAEDEIGVIVIGAEHAALVRDRIAAYRKGKRTTPVIVEVPSRDGAWQDDATGYYQQLCREFLGLEIVLQDVVDTGTN